MVQVKAAANNHELRHSCRGHDLEPSYYVDGKRYFLTAEQMQRLMQRCEAAEMASAKYAFGP